MREYVCLASYVRDILLVSCFMRQSWGVLVCSISGVVGGGVAGGGVVGRGVPGVWDGS